MYSHKILTPFQQVAWETLEWGLNHCEDDMTVTFTY